MRNRLLRIRARLPLYCDSGAVKRRRRYVEIGSRSSYVQMGISFLYITLIDYTLLLVNNLNNTPIVGQLGVSFVSLKCDEKISRQSTY